MSLIGPINLAAEIGVTKGVRKLPTQAAMTYARRKGWIDIPGGLALLRDRNVPVGLKAKALGLGFLLMVVLQVLEFPLEAAAEAMTGLLATPLMLAFDGLEFLILPILFGAAILARIAGPKPPLR